ncbi:MAG TPA: hypothetical protein VIM16_09665 [Mucilaginibacter sp.]
MAPINLNSTYISATVWGAIQIVASVSNVPTERENGFVWFFLPTNRPDGTRTVISSHQDAWLVALKSKQR